MKDRKLSMQDCGLSILICIKTLFIGVKKMNSLNGKTA